MKVHMADQFQYVAPLFLAQYALFVSWYRAIDELRRPADYQCSGDFVRVVIKSVRCTKYGTVAADLPLQEIF